MAQTLLMNNYPNKLKNMALALWSMTVSVAPVVGPILGGAISDNYHWSWIFFINAPIGVLVVILALIVMRGRETPRSKPAWSATGFILLVVGVGALQLMLDLGKDNDWFNSSSITTLAIVAFFGLTLTVVWDLNNPKPLMSLRLLKNRNFSVGCALISLGMMLYFAFVVLMPMMLQSIYGYTATWAGLVTAPVGLLPILMTPIIGSQANKIDLRIVVTLGFFIFASTMLYRTNLNPQADVFFLLKPQIVMGLAISCFFMPITSLAFLHISKADMASASGLFNFIRTLCSAIGASAVTTLWEKRESLHHARLSGLLDPFNTYARETLETLTSLGMSAEQAYSYLARQVTIQGSILSATELFKLFALCFLFLITLTWLFKSNYLAKAK
jgi:DHA2 family multidrug resistance protein